LGRDVECKDVKDIRDLTREELIGVVIDLQTAALALSERIACLEKENETLRSQIPGGGKGSGLPPFIKPNRKERREAERKERKKRAQSFVRRRDIPTEEKIHYVEECPDCGHKLEGGWEHDRRQVIEIPETPVKIIDHILMARRCGYCGKVHIPKLTVRDGVVGKHRIGLRLMRLIATLSTVHRIPQRTIQRTLSSLYGLNISIGEINEILHKVAEFGVGTYQGILREIRGSPHGNADETGWREDGVNGYLWSVSTKRARYFEFNRSRGSKVIWRILGFCFEGALVCDFYAAYNIYEGPIQRCWAHLLRDLTKLVDKNPEDVGLAEWVERIGRIYKSAKKVARREWSESACVGIRLRFEEKLSEVIAPYLADTSSPGHVLAKRMERRMDELFTFIEYPGCPSENNAAERAIRPAVIARKVSGGTRSERGSRTRSILMSIFGTWTLLKRDPLAACVEMISSSVLQPNPM
jgi:transposase